MIILTHFSLLLNYVCFFGAQMLAFDKVFPVYSIADHDINVKLIWHNICHFVVKNSILTRW